MSGTFQKMEKYRIKNDICIHHDEFERKELKFTVFSILVLILRILLFRRVKLLTFDLLRESLLVSNPNE